MTAKLPADKFSGWFNKGEKDRKGVPATLAPVIILLPLLSWISQIDWSFSSTQKMTIRGKIKSEVRTSKLSIR